MICVREGIARPRPACGGTEGFLLGVDAVSLPRAAVEEAVEEKELFPFLVSGLVVRYAAGGTRGRACAVSLVIEDPRIRRA